ncbi:LysR family transcriptional regulator [Terasakiella sp. A23]|uniref:LysR family transcriptional regulator n=1 Tax=Terasakiella sp. FCG-A23 TaxID=3080561 RepID=UPI0029542287|nr:LysR family transcriptional regulator [Terasakiella sp. A23]MDV7338924.1 LysR family transcriptional regulator [Terasakiella sp. A23]
MDWKAISFDWNQVRAFLASAEEASFSAAAKALNLTQPTVGRQVASLEDHLNVTLFERVGRNLRLTEAGMELLEHVQAMGEAANRVSLAASGQSQSVEGTVRITATDVLAVFLLPNAMRKIRKLYPGITIEMVISNDIQDLQRREADIAIRHGRPSQPNLIAKMIRETDASLYASPDYLEKVGYPKTVDAVNKADFVGFGKSDELIKILTSFGFSLGPDNFKLTSANSLFAWEMVRKGLGIGLMSTDVAKLCPEVQRVLTDHTPMTFPIWLVTHRELHTSRKIRLIFDLLAEELARPPLP